MPYNRNHVRAFMSASEIELFVSSLGSELQSLGTTELKRKLKRVRTLRDKSRDLLQRQKLATRARTGSKLGRGGTANERSTKKATAFDEALKRLERALERRESAAARATGTAKKSARNARPKRRPAAVVLRQALQKKQAALASVSESGKNATRHGRPHDNGIESTPPNVRAEAVESRLHAANLLHIQGHTSTQVRKAQAKRDQRG